MFVILFYICDHEKKILEYSIRYANLFNFEVIKPDRIKSQQAKRANQQFPVTLQRREPLNIIENSSLFS